MEQTELEHSGEKVWVHSAHECLIGTACSIHRRTDHAMRAWPQHWRHDRRIMERLCEHGQGHPDPDDYRVLSGFDPGVHGCDGCCALDRAVRPHLTLIQGGLTEDSELIDWITSRYSLFPGEAVEIIARVRGEQ